MWCTLQQIGVPLESCGSVMPHSPQEDQEHLLGVCSARNKLVEWMIEAILDMLCHRRKCHGALIAVLLAMIVLGQLSKKK